MNNMQLIHYNRMLQQLKDKQALIERTSKMESAEELEEEEIREGVEYVQETLHEAGIDKPSDLKKNIKRIGDNADAVLGQVKSSVLTPGFAGSLITGGISMTIMPMIGQAFNLVIGKVWNWVKEIGHWFTGINTTQLGVAAVLFFFGWMFLKIYKIVVNKAKKSKPTSPQPTREEMFEVFNTNNIIRESMIELQENMSPNKQISFMQHAIGLCQDALDLIGTAGMVGLSWIALTGALTPLMMICLVGSSLWVLLSLVRNVIKREKNYKLQQKQF